MGRRLTLYEAIEIRAQFEQGYKIADSASLSGYIISNLESVRNLIEKVDNLVADSEFTQEQWDEVREAVEVIKLTEGYIL